MKTLGGWQITHTPDGWEWISPHGKISTSTVTYTAQTLTDLKFAENTRIDHADLVASERDEHSLTRAEARRTAIDTVLNAANPAAFWEAITRKAIRQPPIDGVMSAFGEGGCSRRPRTRRPQLRRRGTQRRVPGSAPPAAG